MCVYEFCVYQNLQFLSINDNYQIKIYCYTCSFEDVINFTICNMTSDFGLEGLY